MQPFLTNEFYWKDARRTQLSAWVKVWEVDPTAKDPVRESRNLKVRTTTMFKQTQMRPESLQQALLLLSFPSIKS